MLANRVHIHPHLIAIVTLLLLIALLYSHQWIGETFKPGDDAISHDVPLAMSLVDAFDQGRLPFWNPHKACGIPFTETPFMGPYYPAAILYLVLPVDLAITYGFLLHILLSGIFMYLLALQYNLPGWIALLCAGSWLGSAVFHRYVSEGWLPETISAAYLPVLLYFFDRLLSNARGSNLVISTVLGICISLVINGGHPSYSVITISCLLFFAIPSAVKKRCWLHLLYALGIAMLLSSVTWGPLSQEFTSSMQTHATRECYDFFGAIASLVLFIPRTHFGALMVLFALFGVRFLTDVRNRNLLSLLVLSLAAATLGDARVGGHEVGAWIPVYSLVAHAWAWDVGVVAVMVLLAGQAVHTFTAGTTFARFKILTTRRVVASILFLQLCSLMTLQLMYELKPRFSLDTLSPDLQLLAKLSSDPSLFRVSNQLGQIPGLSLNGGAVHGLDIFESRAKGVDLSGITGKYAQSNTIEGVPSEQLLNLCNIKYILTSGDIPSQAWVIIHEFRAPDADLLIDYYLSLFNRHWLSRTILSTPTGRLLRTMLLPASRILIPRDLRTTRLYLNQECLPRAFTVPLHTASQWLSSNYTHEAFLDIDFRDEVTGVRVELERTWNEYRILIPASTKGFLFLSEMYHAGWRAKVDGKQVSILSPFGFFMGVLLNGNQHEVVIKYVPVAMRSFFFMHALGMLFSVAMAMWKLLTSNSDSKPPGSGSVVDDANHIRQGWRTAWSTRRGLPYA